MNTVKRAYTSDSRNLPFTKVNAEFEHQLSNHPTYRSAFEAAQENTGRLYSSYESFKAARSQKKKKR